MKVRAGFGMDRQDVASRLSKCGEVGVDRRDHQMDIKRQIAVRSERANDVWADGDIGHEMPVHHINMNPICARLIDRLNLFTQARKVR